jgi:hypothetical protein
MQYEVCHVYLRKCPVSREISQGPRMVVASGLFSASNDAT